MILRLALIALGFLLTAASCKEEIDDSDGPIASSEVVLKDICYRLSAPQLQKLKVGEKSIAAKSMAFMAGSSEVVEVHRLQVLSEERQTCNTSGGGQVDCNEYEFFEELEDLKNNDIFHFERVLFLPVVDTASGILGNVNLPGITLHKKEEQEAMESTIGQEICYLTEDLYREVGILMTFHNFKSRNIVRDPPLAVRQRPNCGNIENCQIQSTEFEFDQQFIGNDGSRFRRHFMYEISNNVPFTSRYLKRCITHSIPQHFDDNGNGRVDPGEIRILPVHECRDVVDFEFAP
jgi:hypothetical protein